MLTSGVNSEIRNVIGLISPCHSPSQNPAGSGPVSTISFGPAAHADNISTARATTSTKYLRAFRIRPPPLSVEATALSSTRAIGPGGEGRVDGPAYSAITWMVPQVVPTHVYVNLTGRSITMEVISGSRGREVKSRQPDQSDLAHPDVVGLRSTDILATLDDAAADSDRRTRSAIPAASVDAYASLLTIEVKAAGGG